MREDKANRKGWKEGLRKGTRGGREKKTKEWSARSANMTYTTDSIHLPIDINGTSLVLMQ